MSATIITLMIMGLIFIFGSFIFANKIMESKESEKTEIEIPDELTQEQKDKIDELINEYIDERIDAKLDDIEKCFSEIINEKTLALGDYAVTVNEEIERNHNEVMFLYSMLSDKQKEIMSTAQEVDAYRKDIEDYVNNRQDIVQIEEDTLSEAIKEIDEDIMLEQDAVEDEVDSSMDVILEMYKSGLSILEIAKHLGLGVGEVKLVVDLYQGVAE